MPIKAHLSSGALSKLGLIEEIYREAAHFRVSNPKLNIGHWLSSTQFADAPTKGI
jgi:hypothetical protein